MKSLVYLILPIAIFSEVGVAAQDTITVQFTNPHQHIGPYSGNGQGGWLFRFHTDSVFYYDGASDPHPLENRERAPARCRGTASWGSMGIAGEFTFAMDITEVG